MLLLGNPPARAYLERAGIRLLGRGDAGDADVVFVATPEDVDFDELEHAARAILAGARLLTGSYAPAYAGANGPIISRGAMTTAALAKASGARPVIVGKPSRAALHAISDQVGAKPSELAVIGDDVSMDIALGRMGGSRTILVRSGISGRVELDDIPARLRPDVVIDGIGALLDWL